jgi:hypothetical protein
MSQKKTILLVDYENIHHIDLSIVQNQEVDIKIFVGQAQSKIPMELVQTAQKLGERVEWIKVDGSGNNALDFYIAFYLGKLTHGDHLSFVILSKDKGFDPLIKHINKIQIKCKRIEELSQLIKSQSSKSESSKSQTGKSESGKSQVGKSEPSKSQAGKSESGKSQAGKSESSQKQTKPVAENQDLMKKVMQNLSKIEKGKRPKTRKSLHQHVKTLLPPNHKGSHTVDGLINTLFAQNKVSEISSRLNYNF